MDEIGQTHSRKSPLILIGLVVVIILGVGLGVFKMLGKPSLVSPLSTEDEEKGNVRVIFASPVPSASESATRESSPSATPKSKVSPSPSAKASPKATPKATPKPSVSPSGSPAETPET